MFDYSFLQGKTNCCDSVYSFTFFYYCVVISIYLIAFLYRLTYVLIYVFVENIDLYIVGFLEKKNKTKQNKKVDIQFILQPYVWSVDISMNFHSSVFVC